MVSLCILVGNNNIILAVLLVSVSVSLALVSTALYPTSATLEGDVEDIIVVTEFLDNEQYVRLFSEPPYTINVIGYWNTEDELIVKVTQSDIENVGEMSSLVKSLLASNERSANDDSRITEHEYERWNDLLSSTINGTKIPTLSYSTSASDPDIVIKLTDAPHANNRIRAETILDLDGKRITSSEIIIYNANRLYKDGEFIAVLQHELGHAIGLGHSNYIGSIMYPSLVIINDEIVGEISGCEAEGIKHAYSTTIDNAECIILLT